MKSELQYFIASCVLLILLGSGGYYYHTTTISQLQVNYDTQLAALSQEVADQHDSLTALLEEQKLMLEGKITGVKEEQEALTGELERVEVESSGKIAGIQKELMNIDVESKGFTTIIEEVKGSIVSLRTNLGYGSGVVIDRDGYVLTNYHVVKDINALAIVFADGKHYPGRIAGYHVKADLAVIKIGSENRFKPLSFEDFTTVSVGDKVIALGSPAGLDFSVTEGIVSSVDRKSPSGYTMIQTSVPINPGNSGGPLVNGNGLIVGINTYKLSEFEALGFAMNSDTAKQIALQIVDDDQEKIAAAEAQA